LGLWLGLDSEFPVLNSSCCQMPGASKKATPKRKRSGENPANAAKKKSKKASPAAAKQIVPGDMVMVSRDGMEWPARFVSRNPAGFEALDPSSSALLSNICLTGGDDGSEQALKDRKGPYSSSPCTAPTLGGRLRDIHEESPGRCSLGSKVARASCPENLRPGLPW
jgi:hypothetical protein